MLCLPVGGVVCVMDDVSCAGVAEQLKAASQTSSGAADSSSVSSASQQPQSQPRTQPQPQTVSRHPGLSEAAFKRVVGESPPSPDELEKVKQ